MTDLHILYVSLTPETCIPLIIDMCKANSSSSIHLKYNFLTPVIMLDHIYSPFVAMLTVNKHNMGCCVLFLTVVNVGRLYLV